MNSIPRVLDASDERILAEQRRPVRTTVKPASEKQLDLIAKLATERSFDLSGYDLSTLTGGRTGTASELITALFKVDRPATEGTTRVDPEPGLYRVKLDGDTEGVVRIQVSKSGNWYARLAVKPQEGSGKRTLDWNYLGKRIDMRNAVAMTEAEAGRFLVHCVRCGAELTNEDSKAAGMGPICRTR